MIITTTTTRRSRSWRSSTSLNTADLAAFKVETAIKVDGSLLCLLLQNKFAEDSLYNTSSRVMGGGQGAACGGTGVEKRPQIFRIQVHPDVGAGERSGR